MNNQALKELMKKSETHNEYQEIKPPSLTWVSLFILIKLYYMVSLLVVYIVIKVSEESAKLYLPSLIKLFTIEFIVILMSLLYPVIYNMIVYIKRRIKKKKV